MSVRIGVLAEDRTDCKVVSAFVSRVSTPGAIRLTSRGSKGCSILERKRTSWIKTWQKRGISHFILIRDLDRNPENNTLNEIDSVRRRFADFESDHGENGLLIIPVEELEAWFWADEELLLKVASEKNAGKAKAVASPHLVAKPKEKLIDLSRRKCGKPTYTTNDNERLAQELNLDVARAKCPALDALLSFLESVGSEASLAAPVPLR